MVLWYLRDPNEAKGFKEGAPRRKGAPMAAGFSLVSMALKYLKLEIPDLKDFFKDHSFSDIDAETGRLYACADADVVLRLYLKGQDPSLQSSFTYRLDHQVLPVLMDIEDVGVRTDRERLDEIEKDTRHVVTDTRSEACFRLQADTNAVNIDSSTQLARHLYNTLGWPLPGKRRKDGLGSTDANTMARFAESSDPRIAEAAKAYMEYKKWFTLHNNFLTKLPNYINPLTNSIHCRFFSTVVPTGRLACGSPNLQQIPRKRKDGRAPLRRAFRARPSRLLVAADFSQIELICYAGETQESYYFDAFERNVDLHLKTASLICREQITDKKDPRRTEVGKTMNFGPIYGMKPEGLAMRTDYTLAEAERIMDEFFSNMPDAVRWTREIHRKAKEQGGVHTHFGRWRPLPWLRSSIAYEVEFGERSAVNTIIQGTAADILKIALVRLHKTLPNSGFDAYLILTIHDSVMLEVAEDTDLKAFAAYLEQQMCFPIEGYPQLKIDVEYGRNWHDMESIEEEVPDEKPSRSTEKQIPLPPMTPEQERQFFNLVQQARGGDLMVTFLNRDSRPIGSPIPMDGPSYQKLLLYAVSVATELRSRPATSEAPDDLAVSFA